MLSGGLLKILVAEDNNINQMVLASMLVPTEVELEFVANGREALGSASFDWVLMDIQMPEMDGFEALKLAHSNPACKCAAPRCQCLFNCGVHFAHW